MRLALSALVLLLVGCGSPTANSAAIEADHGGGAAPWTHLDANDADADFHFVIVSDRTGGARPGVFASAVPKVGLLEPAFVLSVGDLIEGYTEDLAQIDAEWDEFDGFIEELEVPFFYVAGNHDMSNRAMAEAWQARFGPSYYRFVYKDVLFIVLNSELFGMVSDPDTPVPGPWTQAEQLAFVERTLAEVPDPRWTIVVVHQPLWDYGGGARGDWPQVEAMLAGRDHTVFAGHFHHYVKHIRQDNKYFTLATTGGGSDLRGGIYGEFDHVAMVSMTAAGPRIANLMLDGIHDEDVVTANVRDTMRWLQEAVTSEPILGEGETFSEGPVAFRVANDGSEDLIVAYHVDPAEDLRFHGAGGTATIAPGASEPFTFELSAREPLPYAAIRPGRVFWSLSTSRGGEPVHLDVTSALLPVAALPLPKGDVPTVDGDLAEWNELPHRVDRQGDIASAPTASTDIAYSFGLREAGGDLYLAARVEDDSLLIDPDRGLLTQDSLMIALDSRDDPARSANLRLHAATRRDLAQMAVGFVTLADIVEESYYLKFLQASRDAVQWKTQITEKGYDVELKVDGAYLDTHAGGTWETVRLAIAAVDWDQGESVNRIPWYSKGTDAVVLYWLPDRFGRAPVAASGTFVRSPGD